ncbi:hypothetical protein PV325_011948 [Microctonus aethiopoides]|nr:hypothetical protein PV325_011948 [Microctonus aethiopoides]KAK0093628.1 hypothetical protein PV326_013055 [Microctonus aethiopoides]
MLEDQPLDLSVRVGDYAEYSREDDTIERDHRDNNDSQHYHQQQQQQHNHQQQQHDRNREIVEEYGSTTLRIRDLVTTTTTSSSSIEYSQIEDRTCSEDSDDSCSDSNQKDGTRIRTRPPGTKPYKKNLMRRYRELFLFSPRAKNY